tara:strand:- start:277 stop:759 length:483 start_codon:yes stop_codon:yes gene_type:complete
LVVLVKHKSRFLREKGVPQGETWEATMSKREVSRDNLSFRSGVRYAGLSLANSRYRETRVWSPNGEVISRSALLRRCTSGKVGIGEEMWLKHVEFITDPPNHPKMLGRVDVTHKSMKLAVTLGRPLGDKSRQVTNRTQQVKAAKPSSIEDLHQNLSGNRL